jgi:hypothetical protein
VARCVVRYAVLPPTSIFNLTSPRYLPEISLKWQGRYHWHHMRYEPLRDIVEGHYVRRFNDVSGHYERLLDSVARDGFRNPIMVSAGRLERRKAVELPPALRQREDLLVSEYLGGSRLWAAQQLGIDVPCVVNDYADVLPNAEVLPNASAVLAKFKDAPGRFEMQRKGPVTINNLPFMHLPESERYGMSEQILVRRAIVGECKQKVAEWLAKNDH